MLRKFLPTRQNMVLPIVLASTVILRLAYWIAVAREPWFQTPGMDPEFYRSWAGAIISGHGANFIPFPRAPLYSYLLAGIMDFFGDGMFYPRLFNLGCDLVTVIAIWTLASRAAGRMAAFIAAALFALSGMAIYMSGEVLMTSLETTLAALLLLTFVSTLDAPGIKNAAMSGFLAAMLALCRPNALLLVLAIPVILSIYPKRSLRIALPQAGSALLLALLVLAPVTYFNYMATGKIIPVATQGGVNFYIGNARGSTGWSSYLPGVGADWTDADAAKAAESDAGRPLDQIEQSQQLFKMGLDEIKYAPAEWLNLMTRKILLLHNIREIGNNRPLSLPTESAPFLRVLFLISLGGLLPIALVGLIQSRTNRPLMIGTLTFILLFGGSLLFFFISSRYRLPLVPATAVFAGIGLSHILKSRSNILQKGSLAGIAIGLAIAIPPWGGAVFDDSTQGYFVTGNSLLRQQKYREAVTYYDRASAQQHTYPKLHLNKGVALLAAGDTSKAITEFQLELSLFPERGEALNNLGVIAESKGDQGLAKRLYQQAYTSGSGTADAGENLLRITLQSGDYFFQQGILDSAESNYSDATELGINDPRPYYRLALVAASRGDYGGARKNAAYSLSLKPDYQPAADLLRELPSTE